MKIFVCIVTLAVALSLMGCPARSLFPLFLDKDLVFNQGLVGAWFEKDKNNTYLFQKGEGKNYLVIVADKKGDTTQYKVQLGQLGKFRFLDSYPREEPANYHMMPTHLISKMWLHGDTLKFAPLESDSLKKIIESGKLKCSTALLEDNVILTGSTEELQQVVGMLANDDRFFPKLNILTRVK